MPIDLLRVTKGAEECISSNYGLKASDPVREWF